MQPFKLSYYIARRYLFAKKSHNIINIISIISLVGVAVGVMALVIVLSVFNGFDSLIKKMYSNIDADIRIVPIEGKTFSTSTSAFINLNNHKGIEAIAEVLEENAIFSYGSKKHIGTIKGVSRNYQDISGIDSVICNGQFGLWRENQPLAIMGRGVAYYLNVSIAQFEPITVYIPKRGKSALSMEAAFERRSIMPSGVFAIEQDFDVQYTIAPIEFVRKLLVYDSTIVSAIEIKAKNGYSINTLKAEIENIMGDKFKVQDRYQQNESLYRTMKTEKLVIGLILVLILVIASFNIVGSLSMLIIEKRKDVGILKSLGADNDLIKNIFLHEGILISVAGTVLGAGLGLILCWIQTTFKIIRLDNRGSFIIDAYPVEVQFFDIAIILTAVLIIGYLCARFPVRMITKRIFDDDNIQNVN